MAVVVPTTSPTALIVHADWQFVKDYKTAADYAGNATETFGGVGEVTHFASATPAVATDGRPVALGANGLLTHVTSGSPWIVNYEYDNPGIIQLGETPDPVNYIFNITEERGVFFDPLGAHDDLAPLVTRTITYRAQVDGGAEADATVTVVGAAGLPKQRAVSVVALDGDGDPVAFRFDRPMAVGLTPDRVAFVVAEALTRPAITGVRFLSNDGVPQDIALTDGKSRIVTWRGATLWVLAAPGRIPVGAPTALTITTTYGSKVVEPTWGAEWSNPAGTHAKLTVKPNFETLHLYLDAGAGEATVRFRPATGGRWFPAQPLWFDDPTVTGRKPADYSHTYFGATVTMDEIIPGAHRGVILHLAAGTDYEVEVAHDGAVYRQMATTLSYKPAKTSWAIGTRTAVISVERSGDNVVVSQGWGGGKTTLHTFTNPAGYVELTGLKLTGAALYINTHGVIIRDPDIFGAPGTAVRLGSLAYDVRLVRGRYRCWGEEETTDSGWGIKGRACGLVLFNQSTTFDGGADMNFFGGSGGANDVPGDEQHGNHRLAFIGMLIGAPRHPANTWEHWRDDSPPPSGSQHPYGSTVFYSARGSFLGRNAVLDCSVDAPRFKATDELFTGDTNGSTRGPCGPDFLLAHTYMSGSTDDAVELDGTGVNCVVVGFHSHAIQTASESLSPRAGISAGPNYWGPVIISRFVSHHERLPWAYVTPNVVNNPFGFPTTRPFKFTRRDTNLGHTADNGWVFIFHSTSRGADLPAATNSERQEHAAFWQVGAGGLIYASVHGVLHRQRDNFTVPSGDLVVWGANDVATAKTGDVGAGQSVQLGYIGDTAILADPTIALAATRAWNINDGGPWGVADADLRCGAAT